jgi:hypothetical protein
MNADLFAQLPHAVQEEVDGFIIEQRILYGMIKLKEALDITLAQSIFLFTWRYDVLRVSQPGAFKVSHEEYWQGFIS